MEDLKSKVYPQINEFSGINTGVSPFNIGDSESSDEKNLTSDKFPSISQRMREEIFIDCSNDVFKKILHVGYLFDGSLFCVARKDEDQGKYKFYKYSEENKSWGKFINGGYQHASGSTAATEGQFGDLDFNDGHTVSSVNWSGQKTFISTGIIKERTNANSGKTYSCVGYIIRDNSIEPDRISYYLEEIGFNSDEDGFITKNLLGTFDFFAVKDGRLISASKNLPNMCVSEYGQMSYKNADDTAIFEVPTEAGDNGTGIFVFNDTTIYFKRNATYILYGKTPDSYYLDNLSNSVGCVSQKSIAETNSGIIWLGADGFYMYGATTRPYKISQKVQKYIDNIEDAQNACGVSDGKKYYISIMQKSGNHVMLVYDTELNVWHVWDSMPYSQLMYKEEQIYGIANEKIYKLLSHTNNKEWYYISKPFDVGGISRKSNVNSLFLNVSAKRGAKIKVFISGDSEGNNFKMVMAKSFTSDKNEKIEIRTAPSKETRNMEYLRIKLEGIGECQVHSIEVFMRVKGRSY